MPGGKNVSNRWRGKKAAVAGNGSQMYPAEDVKKPLMRYREPSKAKLRPSIQPGTVLILLAGRFRGKRVVFLKSLSSGALLVSGPFQISGVPLRRVNQAYVIATSFVVDLSGVTVPDIDDEFFAKKKEQEETEEEQFFSNEPKAAEVSEERKDAQQLVDTGLMEAIKAVPLLEAYLGARFTLRKGDRPHKMRF